MENVLPPKFHMGLLRRKFISELSQHTKTFEMGFFSLYKGNPLCDTDILNNNKKMTIKMYLAGIYYLLL